MALRCAVRPGAYFDSVVLMRIAAELESRPGVEASSLVMATPANKAVLGGAGLLDAAAERAGPNDLVIALRAGDDALDDAIAAADAALHELSTPSAGSGDAPRRPRSLAQVDADLALISTPGPYAAAEAHKALRRGMSVFLFSDNVALEHEVRLKREARERGLIVMGPDCGTAIVGGVPLGFANDVRAGDIGLIGASGTGLQQVSTLLDRWGSGVSQAVGVGGRDLSAEVGAVSMLDALDALAADPGTRVIALISKPPDPEIAERVLDRAASAGKRVVAAFLGVGRDAGADGVEVVHTLEDAARAALLAAGGSPPPQDEVDPARLPAPLSGERRLLRALYAGGTFAYEARVLLGLELGALSDDAHPPGDGRAAALPAEHLVVDLGDDRFTAGRPHPMIDPAMRLELLRAAGADSRTAVVVLDVVLGHGAADDPAGDLAPAIAEVTGSGDAPLVVAFVVGTAADPQDLERQERTLREAGAELAPSSTAAARLALAAVGAEVAA
jgi:FdrA protein